jgi:hypothetical protein
MRVSKEFMFNIELNLAAVMTIQEALSWAREHKAYPASDPVHKMAEEFTKLVENAANVGILKSPQPQQLLDSTQQEETPKLLETEEPTEEEMVAARRMMHDQPAEPA